MAFIRARKILRSTLYSTYCWPLAIFPLHSTLDSLCDSVQICINKIRAYAHDVVLHFFFKKQHTRDSLHMHEKLESFQFASLVEQREPYKESFTFVVFWTILSRCQLVPVQPEFRIKSWITIPQCEPLPYMLQHVQWFRSLEIKTAALAILCCVSIQLYYCNRLSVQVYRTFLIQFCIGSFCSAIRSFQRTSSAKLFKNIAVRTIWACCSMLRYVTVCWWNQIVLVTLGRFSAEIFFTVLPWKYWFG